MKNQAKYVRADESWMLGAFVLPIDKFDAVKEMISWFDSQNPLRVSALGPKTMNATVFSQAVAKVSAAIGLLSAFDASVASVEQLEMFLPEDVVLASLRETRTALGNLPVFWEAPPDRAEQTIRLIAEVNSEIEKPNFGFKLRTGGVTADAFPTSIQIAKVLGSVMTQRVPIKFTAGLHHPVRQYRDEVKTKMHGFLNVLGAAVLAREHKWEVKQIAAMLEDEEANAFSFGNQSFAWRDWEIDVTRLKQQRRFVTSFGSCSFDEPREDLRALNLL